MEKVQVKLNNFFDGKIFQIICLVFAIVFTVVLANETLIYFLFYESELIQFFLSQSSDKINFLQNPFPIKEFCLNFTINLWGDNVNAYRILNLILHLGNAVGVWWYLKRFNSRQSALLAVLFLVNPIHIFSLHTIEAFDIILASSFIMLSFFFYLKQIKHDKLLNINNCFSFLFFALSLFTHYAFFFFPLFMGALAYIEKAIKPKDAWGKLIPFIILMIARVVTLFNSIGFYEIDEISKKSMSLIMLFGARINHAIESFFTISNLSPLYSFDMVNSFSLYSTLTLCMLVLFGFVIKSRRINVLGGLLIILMLPFLFYRDLEYSSVSPYIDKQFYVLSFFIFIYLFEWLFYSFKETKKYISILFVCFIILASFNSFKYRKVFFDSRNLYVDSLKDNPYNSYVFYELMKFEINSADEAAIKKLLKQYVEYKRYFTKEWTVKIDYLIENLEKKKGESPRP